MTAVISSCPQVQYSTLPTNEDEARQAVAQACAYMQENNAPYAFLVKKGTFEKCVHAVCAPPHN